MTVQIRNARVLLPDGSWKEACPVTLENGIIRAVGEELPADEVLDFSGLLLLPGLVDMHTHGRAGFDFTSATEAEMHLMKADYARHGVTTLFPTLASATKEEWTTAIGYIHAVGFDGVHLEGRYLNPLRRGAHAPELLCPLDPHDLSEYLVMVESLSMPIHLTAAFELDESGDFAALAKRSGATLSLGHTDATYEQAMLAMERGVTSFTHLFNAMPPLHHRAGGAVAAALTSDAFAELIVDGMHVAPEMVKLVYQIKGVDKLILITDSMSATGCADGNYSIAGQPVVVKNGRAETLDGKLAGSTLNLWDAVKNLTVFADAPLAEAVLCASRNPARALGISGHVGSIAPGLRADLLAVTPDLNIQTVFAGGKRILED